MFTTVGILLVFGSVAYCWWTDYNIHRVNVIKRAPTVEKPETEEEEEEDKEELDDR